MIELAKAYTFYPRLYVQGLGIFIGILSFLTSQWYRDFRRILKYVSKRRHLYKYPLIVRHMKNFSLIYCKKIKTVFNCLKRKRYNKRKTLKISRKQKEVRKLDSILKVIHARRKLSKTALRILKKYEYS